MAMVVGNRLILQSIIVVESYRKRGGQLRSATNLAPIRGHNEDSRSALSGTIGIL